MSDLTKGKDILRNLGDGLILRRATVEDAEALVEFNAQIHSDSKIGKPDSRIAAWTRDLMTGTHPTFQVGDFTVVEDTHSKRIVSAMNLISQVWEYQDIPFKVGRPELVGTLLEYRNRSLVRAQFEIIHQWSAERGEVLQAITGIPYYYRLFGYEMGLGLSGGRIGYSAHVPVLPTGEHEPFNIRKAISSDLNFLSTLYNRSTRRYLVRCIWTERLWEYELQGKSEENINRMEWRIIETLDGNPIGYLAHPFFCWGSMMPVSAYELLPGYSWAAITPTVIRYLQSIGSIYLAQEGSQRQLNAFHFCLGSEHPVYQAIPERLPKIRKPYAWYLRVADLPGFLRLISPALEQRLAGSSLAGHSGELKITFYRSGVRLVFEQGRLVTVEAWKPTPVGHVGDAGFPDLTFLQLLFGYRSFDELNYAFADCWCEEYALALLNALFPRQVTNLWPVS